MYVQYIYSNAGTCNDYIPFYSFCDNTTNESQNTKIENFACGCMKNFNKNNNLPNMTYVWEGFDNSNFIYPPNITDANIISKSNPNASCPNPICPMRVGCPCLPGCVCPKIQSNPLKFINGNMQKDIFYKSNSPSGFDDVQ